MLPEDTTFNEQDEIDLEEQARIEAKLKAERDRALQDLAQRIESKFQERRANRQIKEQEWLECTRLFLGNLSSDVNGSKENPFIANNKTPSDRPMPNIVSSKCDIAISQCQSMQFSTGEKNWDLWASPNEVNPQNIRAAELMSLEIETQLDNCKYGFNARQAITDRVILGTGILKGPVNTGKLCRQYAPAEDGITWLPTVKVDYYPEIIRVNPWFFYPDDSVAEFKKCQDSIEVHPMSAVELAQYKQHEGFDADVITEILKEKPAEYEVKAFSEYSKLTNSNPYLFRNKYCLLEYHGPITIDEMQTIGIEPTYDSPTEEYYGEIWVCQGKIVRIQLENIEGSFEIPYAASIWKSDPCSVFGFGMPLTMRDAQRVATATWHMILDNSSLSSGPQVAIQKRFIQPQDGIMDITPYKLWYLTDPMMKVEDAIQFFDVPNVTKNLIPVLQLSREFAQEESSTPLIAAGMESSSNQESATGQLIANQNSTVLLDFLAEQWDDDVTQKVIERMYAWNMQYSPKPEIKGNYIIDVRSSTEYKNKQLYIRDVERLSLEMAQNPEMAKRIKPDELTKIRLEMMHLPNRSVIRTDEEVAQYEQQLAQQPSPEQMDMQVKMMELEQKKMELQLKAQQLMFEKQQQQQRELWDHEEKMAANYARINEAQASVLKAQTEKETEMIKLAAQAQTEDMKQKYLLQANTDNNQTKVFIKAMEEQRKEHENLLYAREIDLAKNKGEGI